MIGAKTPGQLLVAALQRRGWTQRVLAIVLGIDDTSVNKMANDKRRITAEMAVDLGDVLGIDPELFLDLQKHFDLYKARFAREEDLGRALRAHLFGKLPVSEMIQRGWINADDVRDVDRVSVELARFFGVSSPEEIEIVPHAARKTEVAEDVTEPQLAWLHRMRHLAEDVLVPRYSPQAVRSAIKKFSGLRSAPELTREVPRTLMECGVRFVIVQTLASAKIDGVAFWLNDRSPVVGMSLRYDRIDNFWFVLRHELEHILREHGRSVIMLDAELEGGRAGTGEDVPEEERVANEAASEFCVPGAKMQMFISRKEPFFAERDLLGFARSIHVHPGLVVGQLQHRTGRYELFRRHLAKVRSSVAPGAIVDGWGDIAPVQP